MRVSWCRTLDLDDIGISIKYLHSNTSIECLTTQHIIYIYSMIIPLFIIYFVGGIFIIMKFLKKKKFLLYKILFYEYKKKYRYWEIFRTLVKCAI